MTDFISTLFNTCVWILQVIGDFTGMGYQMANILIFIVIQPALILLFIGLWLRTKRLRARDAVTLENVLNWLPNLVAARSHDQKINSGVL